MKTAQKRYDPAVKVINFNLFPAKPENNPLRSLSMERIRLYGDLIDRSPINRGPLNYYPASCTSKGSNRPENKPENRPENRPENKAATVDKPLKRSSSLKRTEVEGGKPSSVNYMTILGNMKKKTFLEAGELRKSTEKKGYSGGWFKERSLGWSECKENIPPNEITRSLQVESLKSGRGLGMGMGKRPGKGFFEALRKDAGGYFSSNNNNNNNNNTNDNDNNSKSSINNSSLVARGKGGKELEKVKPTEAKKEEADQKKQEKIEEKENNTTASKPPIDRKPASDFQEYRRLQEKLLFLENRIVEMKSNFESAQKTCYKEIRPKSSKPLMISTAEIIAFSNQSPSFSASKNKHIPKASTMNNDNDNNDNNNNDNNNNTNTPTPLPNPRSLSQERSSMNSPKFQAPVKQSPPLDLKSLVTQVSKGHFLPSNLSTPDDQLKKSSKKPLIDKKQSSFSHNPDPELLIEKPPIKRYQSLTKRRYYYIDNITRAYRITPVATNQTPEEAAAHRSAREHFVQTFQSIAFAKTLNHEKKPEKTLVLPRKDSRKTLIFDLDETLIHCNESPDLPCDIRLPISFPTGQTITAGVNIRPGAREVLLSLSSHYELIVFTASHSCYANVVLDYLDPSNTLISHRLYREHCLQTPQGVFIKDLRVLLGNRRLEEMLIVDNAAYSFGLQIDNGVPILPFYDDRGDRELEALKGYLLGISGGRDLREVNRRMFRLGELAGFEEPEEAVRELYGDCF